MIRRTLSGVTLVALAACDRVTAPRALQIADDIEHKLDSDGYVALESVLSIFYAPGVSLYRQRQQSPINLSRDGVQQGLSAVVVERVYMADGNARKSVTRRTFIAWPENASFGLVAVTEVHPGRVGTSPSFSGSGDHLLDPPALLTLHFPRKHDSWVPRGGIVDISAGAVEGECPFGVVMDPDEARSVRCELTEFDVRLQGELVREADLQDVLLGEARAPRHRVEMPVQRVHGFRFTVDCRAPISRGQLDRRCHEDVLRFWRDNALFAKSLDVDIKAIPFKHGYYSRQLHRGRPDYTNGNDWVLRWTVFAPDGRMLLRDSIVGADYRHPTPPDWSYLLIGDGVGARRQYLMPATILFPDANYYDVVVVDAEYAAAK